MKDGSDPCTYLDNMSKFSLYIGHLKNSGGFNGIRNHDLCDANAINADQLSYNSAHDQLGAVYFFHSSVISQKQISPTN